MSGTSDEVVLMLWVQLQGCGVLRPHTWSLPNVLPIFQLPRVRGDRHGHMGVHAQLRAFCSKHELVRMVWLCCDNSKSFSVNLVQVHDSQLTLSTG